MPVFKPSEEEFANPIDYFEKLYHQHEAAKYGCVKVIPPPSFKPPLAFDMESETKLPTRYQILQKLSQGVPFNQNTDGHSFKEFEALSREREKGDSEINWDDDEEIYEKIETDYWNKVENQVGEEEKVEYAADLNAKKYGSGFGTKTMPKIPEGSASYVDHPWNLSNF